jgi:hypothetical protein
MEKLDGTFDSPEKFAEHLRARRGKKSDLQRFEMIEHREEAVSSGGAVCSRYFMRTKDKGAVTGQTLTLLMAGLTCVHPAEPTLMVDAGYSERGGGEQFSDSLKSVGEKFVTSLRFLTTGAEPQYQAAKQSMKEGATDKAIAALRPLADSGDRRAAFVLAMQLAAARPAPDGYAEARRYFLEAAKDGYVDALFNLGTFYDKAQGVPRDVPQAVKWFKLAADQRDGQAQMNLAIHYGRGDGVPRDLEEADRWLRMAANNGNERARQMLRRR